MSVETGTITLENSLFGEKTFDSTMVEAGGGGGIFVVSASYDDDTGKITLDKTWNEIYTAFSLGQIINILQLYEYDDFFGGHYYPVLGISAEDMGEEWKYTLDSTDNTLMQYTFATDSEDGYPVFDPNA